MGLENMRAGYGRCPPLLAGGLFVMCVILVFNWWSLSSQNYDLLKQLEDLGEQLKISSDEQDLCVRQKQASETKIKHAEDELAKLKVRVQEITTENEDLKKTVETKEEELKTSQKNKEEVQGNADLCNTELDSLKKLDLSKDGTISSLRDAKDRVSTELKELKQTVEKLRSDLSKTQEELSNVKTGKQKNPPSVYLPAGSLPPITTNSAVSARSSGLSGMIYHLELPILPQDPPDAYRPPPRFSISQLKTRKEQPVTQFDDNIAIGGNHELEIEDNNDAKEEPDEAEAAETNAENPDNADNPENAENADANQMGEGEPRMDEGEEDTAQA